MDTLFGRLLEFMAIDANSHDCFCGVAAQSHRIGAVRIVATAAVKFFIRPLGIFFVLLAQRVAGAGYTAYGVRFFFYIPVALQAHLDGSLKEQSHIFRRMRRVARQTHAACHWSMDVLLAEFRFVMTSETQVRGFRFQQFCTVRRVGVVAACAAHVHGGVDVLFGEHGLVMTAVAKIGLVRNEQFLIF